ncbi:MAG TPA: ester cyclase [Anaerolineae bacterium]|nr:ester cyclase [Anaerolineae bacterium]
MSIESNKKSARHLVEDGLNKNNMAVIDEVISAKDVEHALPPGMPPTLAGFKMFISAFIAAFPDVHYTIDHEVAEGNLITHFLTGTGTMKGDFQGIKATNKKGTWSEMHLGRFEGDQIVEHWAVVDQLGMLISVGAMQPPGAQH